MKKHPVLLNFFLIGLIIYLMLQGISPVSGQSENKFYISALDCSTFPTVTMSLRGLDDNNNVISADLLANNYAIYENDTLVKESDVKPLGSDFGPKYVVFSLDLGKTSNLDLFASNIKAALHTFASDFFNESTDTVRIVVNTNDGTQEIKDILSPTKTLSVFESAIDSLNFNPSQNDLEGYLGLEKLYTSLSKLNPGRYSMAIIDFNRLVLGFASPDDATQKAQTLGKQLGSHNIRVYILNTYLPGWNTASPSLNDLSSLSGGDILQFSDSSIRQTKLLQIYNNIKNNSQVYRLQFRAHQYTDVKYSLAPKGGSLAAATDSFTCPNAPVLSLPDVQITQPKGANPVFYLKQNDKTVAITADLTGWPQDGSRKIATVELYDGNNKIDTKNINSNTVVTSFTSDLDVSNLIYSATYHLHVKVIDEFGIVGDSPEVVLTVNPYKPPTESPTSIPTKTTPTTATSCSSNFWTASCLLSLLKEYLVWIVLVVFLIIIIILFNTVRRLQTLSQPARDAFSKGIDQVRKTLLGGTSTRQEVIAYLNVLVARPDRIGGKIEIYNNRTSLGRDPKVTDVQLYQLDEQSSVSSLHCTIFTDQGKFFITDDNSTNGTFVNGKRLEANEPFNLPDGAEIILGDVFRQGAKLRFEIAADTGAQQAPVIEEEPDFHVDVPLDGGSTPKADVDDFRKTVPGYREDLDDGNKTETFHEPPATPAPQVQPRQVPAKKPADGRSGKKDWKDEL
jgi:pSer/pThr/pTyr-binding forkhead associated (FHA) protein